MILKNNQKIKKLKKIIEEEEKIWQKEDISINKKCSHFNQGVYGSENECAFYHPENNCP